MHDRRYLIITRLLSLVVTNILFGWALFKYAIIVLFCDIMQNGYGNRKYRVSFQTKEFLFLFFFKLRRSKCNFKRKKKSCRHRLLEYFWKEFKPYPWHEYTLLVGIESLLLSPNSVNHVYPRVASKSRRVLLCYTAWDCFVYKYIIRFKEHYKLLYGREIRC